MQRERTQTRNFSIKILRSRRFFGSEFYFAGIILFDSRKVDVYSSGGENRTSPKIYCPTESHYLLSKIIHFLLTQRSASPSECTKNDIKTSPK